VEFTNDVSGFMDYIFKPQLKTLGPKYGKKLGEIRTALQNLDGAAAKKELDSTGTLKLALSDGEIALGEEDLLISTAQAAHFVSMTDNGITVVLDTRMTPELIEEGFVREIVSKIQSMRKEADFNVTSNINIYLSGNEKIAQIVRDNYDSVCGDTLGASVVYDTVGGISKEWEINGEKVTLGVEEIQ
jgi:isoleucyl-tRNA synthetase